MTDVVGKAITPSVVIPVVNGTGASGVVIVESVDDTEVTISADTASVTFDLYVG